MAVSKVERRGKTRLVVDIRFRDERTGKRERYRRDAQVQTMAAAQAENRRKLAELGAKGFLADAEPEESAEAPTTFSDAVEAWRATKAKTALKRTTRASYESILRVYLLPRFGEEPLTDVDFVAAERLDADLVALGLAQQTRAGVAIALRSVLRHAAASGALPAMPRLPPLPKVGHKVAAPPSQEEVEAMLRAAYPSARLAILIAADAGLRAGEIRGLRWCDVDLGAGMLVVRQTVYHGEVDTPKSGHERKVPLSPRLAAELLVLKTARRPKPEWHVSLSSWGRPWGQSSLLHAFRAVLGKAGLEPRRLHDLRHFFVTRCFEVGGDAPTVQELAGHEHLSTTQRYAHTSTDRKRDVVARLGGAGNGGATGRAEVDQVAK